MKKVLSLILVVAMCLTLCACGGKAPAAAQPKKETITIHAQIPAGWADPGCWAWSEPDAKDAFTQWPGEAMTRAGDWYVVEAPAWINYVIINGNGGSVQTADLPVEAGKDLWVVVESPENANVFYKEPAAKETITIHTQIPANWADPGCWAWSEPDAKDAFAQWPGEAMTKNGDWYVAEAPNWINYVIINGNGGSVQTADLPVEAGMDLWVVVKSPENAKVFYGEPAAQEMVPALSPEELFDLLGTVEPRKLTDNKSISCVREIKDGEELSKKIVLDFYPEEQVAKAPEEIRYLLDISYVTTRANNYIGIGSAYNRSVSAEIIDVSSGTVMAKKHFPGSKLPDHIVTTNGAYYADYPDEALVKGWVLDQMNADRTQRYENLMNTVKEWFVGRGKSYAQVLENLPEYGEFTETEVRYAADNCGADWNQEAIICAQNWLERGDGYSPQRLLDNVENISGFTREQAIYGVENCGVDWKDEALKVAKYFLETKMGYSHSAMIKVLVGDYGFTEAQAKYAADNCGADWNQVAVDHVELVLKYSDEPYTRERMIQEMVDYHGFTEEQAVYAVNKVGLK